MALMILKGFHAWREGAIEPCLWNALYLKRGLYCGEKMKSSLLQGFSLKAPTVLCVIWYYVWTTFCVFGFYS